VSLRWDVTNVKDREVNFPPTEDGHQNPVTYTLIMLTMSVGIGELTAANVGEFYARASLIDTLDGPFMYEPDGEGGHRDRRITIEDVRGHVGLSTNVFPVETRAAWLKRVVGNHLDQQVRRVAA